MLDRERTLLLIIDIQDVLMPPSPIVVRAFLDNVGKLIRAAQTLEIPLLVTEQNPKRLGETNAELSSVLGDALRVSKLEFGCMGNAVFRHALEATGRTQVLITGMETHICVWQTVSGLLDAGYEPFVARDAVVSTLKNEYKAGLDRIAQAGVPLLTAQMAIFEWLRAAGTPLFKQMLPLLK